MNRATARFILRSRCAGSKGYTPACHDVNKLADSPWPFFASSASQRQLSLSCSDFFSAFLCELCVKSFDSAFPHQAKLPRTTFRVLSYWPELGRAVYRRPHSSAAYSIVFGALQSASNVCTSITPMPMSGRHPHRPLPPSCPKFLTASHSLQSS